MAAWAATPRDAMQRRTGNERWTPGCGSLALLALLYGLSSATHPGTTGSHLTALVLTLTVGVAWTGWLIGRHLVSFPSAPRAWSCWPAAVGSSHW